MKTKCERAYEEPVFGLSTLGYYRNMAVQYDPLPLQIEKAYSKVMKALSHC